MYEIKLLTLLLQNKSNHNNDKVDFVVSQIDKEAAISGFITTISVISLVLPVLVKPCQLSESDQVGKTNLKQTELILSDSLFTSSSV